MEERYGISPSGAIARTDGRLLDSWNWLWQPAGDRSPGPCDLSAVEAIAHLARSGKARRLPVAVIGPREATVEQMVLAEATGRALGALNLTVICGGKGGVMEAAARGVSAAGGLAVGILPDGDWRAANPFIGLPLATGLSEARNAVIAKAAVALIAIGGSFGTLTEVAYGRHFDKPVIGLAGAPAVDGVMTVATADEAVSLLAEALLTLPGMEADRM